MNKAPVSIAPQTLHPLRITNAAPSAGLGWRSSPAALELVSFFSPCLSFSSVLAIFQVVYYYPRSLPKVIPGSSCLSRDVSVGGLTDSSASVALTLLYTITACGFMFTVKNSIQSICSKITEFLFYP